MKLPSNLCAFQHPMILAHNESATTLVLSLGDLQILLHPQSLLYLRPGSTERKRNAMIVCHLRRFTTSCLEISIMKNYLAICIQLSKFYIIDKGDVILRVPIETVIKSIKRHQVDHSIDWLYNLEIKNYKVGFSLRGKRDKQWIYLIKRNQKFKPNKYTMKLQYLSLK